MKSIFNGYIDTFNIAKERISELEDKKIQTCQIVLQRGKKKWKGISNNHRITVKVVMYPKME